jgi:hypothetical protein
MTDFHVSTLLHASLCSLTRVSRRLCVSPTYTSTQWQGSFDNKGSQEEERKRPLAVIPYVSGVRERIRKTYEKFDLRVVFISGLTLH